MKSLGRRTGKRRANYRKERRTFALIACITAIPVLLATTAIVYSTLPDLYSVVPSAKDGALPLSWRTLEDLESRADLFHTEVEMVGYMFSIDHARGQGTAVQRFLLVPDAGNWLSAPHFHPDEVIDVRLQSGNTVPVIDRKPVLVRGMLSVESADLKVARVVYHLTASDVRAYRQPVSAHQKE
jgi:hypothetical protein